MRLFKYLFSFLLLFSSISADPVQDFTHALSDRQKTLLTDFVFAIVDSSAGYVLFGDRPLSIETCELPTIKNLAEPNLKTVALIKGRGLWDELNLPTQNKEYVISYFDAGSESTFICLNRKAFLQAVEDNLILFQYLLGTEVTSESLFSEFLASGERYFQVLNQQQVLLEILLGNGRQNAIAHARLLDISDPNRFSLGEEFPYIPRKLSRTWASLPSKYAMDPSFGFVTVGEEEKRLSKLTVSSNKLKSFKTFQIPCFDCVADSEETKIVLDRYEESRSQIVKATKQSNFLDVMLTKLFTNVSRSVDIPSPPKEIKLSLPTNKEDAIFKLVKIIHQSIGKERSGAKKFLRAFMDGVIAREKEEQLFSDARGKRSTRIQGIYKELECCINLERAETYFHKLASRRDLISLIPEQVYYKVVKKGKGEILTSNAKTATFQYDFQILGYPDLRDWGTVKKESLGALIPGVASSLIGMSQGEERVVFIHPKYAYGEETFYPPNVCILAQIRLLDFEKGDQTALLFPPHKLEKREYKNLLTVYEFLRVEEFFEDGVEFWNTIKKSSNFFDFQTFRAIFSKYLEKSGGGPVAELDAQDGQFIADLEYLLLAFQREF